MIIALHVISALLMLVAGVYRVVGFKFRTVGSKPHGAMTCLGIAIAYPWYATDASWVEGKPLFFWSWIGLGVLGYIKAMHQWCSSQPRRDEATGHSWLGRCEIVFALGLWGLGFAYFGSDAGRFFFIGFLCSYAEVWVVRTRRRLEAWTPEDTARLFGGFQRTAEVAQHTAAKVTATAPKVPLPDRPAVQSGAMTVGSMVWAVLRYAFWRKPNVVPVTAGSGVVMINQPLTWGQRLRSSLVAGAIIHVVSGAIGINILGVALTIVLSIPLMCMGVKVEFPEFVKAPLWGLVHTVKEGMGEAKEHVKEKWDAEKEFLRDKLREKERELAEKFNEKRPELEDKAGREIRRATWGSLFGGGG